MKNKFFKIILAALFVIVVSSCSHKVFTSPQFDLQTADHKVIAILPVSVVLTGTKPKKMTDQDIAKQELAESIIFQESLFNNILSNANTKKYFSTIQIQPLEKTRQILNKGDTINYKNINDKNDEELCKLLGVDAVVRMKVRKTRYLSGLASFGADVLNDILFGTIGVFVPGTTTPVPNAPTKTDDVSVSCSVQSKSLTLWNDNYNQAANWQSPANEIVNNITNYFGKRFPYKKRKEK